MVIGVKYTAGNTAAILARGVLNSMLLNRLRVTTVLLCLGIGGRYWAWHAFASAVDGKGQANPGPAVVRTPGSSQPPRTDRYGDPLPPGAAMRLGTVRFRQTPFIKHIVYSPDGQFVVTDNVQHLQIWDARDGRKLRQLDLGTGQVCDYAFSPDGKTIAAVGFQYEREREVQHLTFTDLATGRLVNRGEWGERRHVRRVAYAPHGKTVAIMSEEGTLLLWDAATAKLLRQERLGGEEDLSSIAFSPDAANHLLAIGRKRAIDLWDVAHLRRVRRIAIDDEHRPTDLAFSPDGTTLAAGTSAVGDQIWLWRVSDGTLLRRLKSQKNTEVYHLSFSPDGKVLAATGREDRLVLFDAATGKELDLLSNVPLTPGALAFSPDGRTLATTGDHQTLHFWELATGKDRLATPEAHQGAVGALAVLADGKTLVSGSDDRTVRIWDLATGRPTKILAHDGGARSISVSADESFLAAGSDYPEWGKVHVWNLKTGKRLHTWSVDTASLRGVTLSGDGSSAIAGFSDGTLRRWDVSNGKERPIAQPKLEQKTPVGPVLDDVFRAVFSRDGRSVALIGREGGAQFADVASGDLRFKEPLAPMAGEAGGEFAPDGRSLAIVREGLGKETKPVDGRVRGDSSTYASTIVWLDSLTGHVRREIVIPESHVTSLAFSPDGQAIAAGTLLFQPARGIIRIFRLRDKQEIQTIETRCPRIEALSFTPDGKQIVTGLQDTSIVIWDVRPPADDRR